MLTYEDCVALCDLTREEIAAIAEHEHIPMIVAAEMGDYLIHTPDGVPALKRMILDDIADAKGRGDEDHVFKLRLVLHHFVETHPQRAEDRAADDGDKIASSA